MWSARAIRPMPVQRSGGIEYRHGSAIVAWRIAVEALAPPLGGRAIVFRRNAMVRRTAGRAVVSVAKERALRAGAVIEAAGPFRSWLGDHAEIDNRAGRGRARHCIDGARWRAGKRRHARADAAAARTAKPRTTRHERRQSRAGQWSHALSREAYCSSTPERVAAAPWPLSRTTISDGVGMDAAVCGRERQPLRERRKDGMSSEAWQGQLKGCRPSASKDIRRRHARIAPRGRSFEHEGPTGIHGMRWVGLNAARAKFDARRDERQ